MIVLNLFLLAFAFVCMEGVAWFTHKYVMHGFLWGLHRDHHIRDHGGFFQRNDFFFLIFAIPGILLLYLGVVHEDLTSCLWVGGGITLYGLTYLVVHDLFIHRRFKFPQRVENPYLLALRRAHRTHHKHLDKEDGECFGMLWVSRPFLAGSTNRE